MDRLEKATRGYGNSISERALYASLTEQGMPVDEFLVLLEWGLLTDVLAESEGPSGRGFTVNRKAIAALRAKANGESTQAGPVKTSAASSRPGNFGDLGKPSIPDRPADQNGC
ncbi:MAG: hypothetical protein WA888_08380 [Burkholderiaceae bacterium]